MVSNSEQVITLGFSHFLALGCDIPRGFDNSLSSIVVLVKLRADGVELRMIWRIASSINIVFGATTGPFDACHASTNKYVMQRGRCQANRQISWV